MSGFRVIEGDCIEVMAAMDEASVDAIVTDPPYGIGFMGHEWDQPGVVVKSADGRRQRQPAAASGAGHARERAPLNGHGEREGTRLGGPTGVDNTTHKLRGGAMHVGRYDLSPPAMKAFQDWTARWAAEAFRLLRPGGHILVSGGTRTHHRMASGLEDAGFEIRDSLAWLYGSGFPKSLDVSKAIDKAAGAEREVVGSKGGRYDRTYSEASSFSGPGGGQITVPATSEAERWQGWGTALKPAFEPIVLARKPLVGTVAANVLEHGTGALNIDGARIGVDPDDPINTAVWTVRADGPAAMPVAPDGTRLSTAPPEGGRWPANVILDEDAAAMLDEQTGGVSRFFYVPKADRAERERGVEHHAQHDRSAVIGQLHEGTSEAGNTTGRYLPRGNHHPTVKPVALMQWLCRLITPPGGVVLDPFLGSGSTGIAALREGFEFVGIEREPEYVAIARDRITGDAPLFNVEEAG